jgi:uncharacterized protein involved in exopolysaccharide biosynthesis
METQQEELGEESGQLLQPDLIKSYLAFALRALRKRRLWIVSVFFLGAALTFAVAALWPRTYHCEMKLMAQKSKALGGESELNPLGGASDILGRHENLMEIVKQTDLVHSWNEQRPPLLHLKDVLTEKLRGTSPSDADLAGVLVAALEARIYATASENTLTIGTDWPNGASAARIVEAAHQVFMESRHVAEISTLQEKIAILEGHASKAREEIDRIAEQLQRVREDRLAQAGKVVSEARGGGDRLGSGSAPAPVVARAKPRASAEPDDQLPLLKEELDTKKRTVAELEADRNRRLSEAQAKLTDLQPKFTAAHPLVREVEQNIANLSHESPRVAALRAEIDSLERSIKERATITRADASPGPAGGGSLAPAAAPSAGGDVLSTEIMQLLGNAVGVDPTMSAQLQGAVSKYGALRDAISTARIDLDTAQAAFSYRYKVIVPPEVPGKPVKPKLPTVLGAGLAAALLLALLLPILAELRNGVIVERWQVYMMQLPILAELKYPPGSSE